MKRDIKLDQLKLIDNNIALDKYIYFREEVKGKMDHPEWIGDFSVADLNCMLNNGSKIWIYYLDNDPVCSMMFIPSSKDSAIKLGLINYDYNKIGDYGPMMVSNKYVGNGLQYQMLNEIDKYSKSIGLEYVVGTIHPDNVFSINNLLKDGFVQAGQKTFTRGLRNIYLKKL